MCGLDILHDAERAKLLKATFVRLEGGPCPCESRGRDRVHAAVGVGQEVIHSSAARLDAVMSAHAGAQHLAVALEAGVHAGPVGQLLACAGVAPRTGPAAAALFGRILDPAPVSVPLIDQVAADGALCLRDVQVRDALVAWLTPGSLDPNVFRRDAEEVLSALPHPSPVK